MERYQVMQIDNLLNFDLQSLVKESKEEGFRFVERLVNDYESGANTFKGQGEGLFGVFDEESMLVGICGLNNDPFSNDQEIGRLRRFYVSNRHRRNGVGSLLVNKVIIEAKKHYRILVLHTDTEQANRFYKAIGFAKTDFYPNSTHYLTLLEVLHERTKHHDR